MMCFLFYPVCHRAPCQRQSWLREVTWWAKNPLQDGDPSENNPHCFPSCPVRISGSSRICAGTWDFKRKYPTLDTAHSIRHSVLSSSWDIFLVTVSYNTSETCAIYSSLTLGLWWQFFFRMLLLTISFHCCWTSTGFLMSPCEGNISTACKNRLNLFCFY